MTIIISKYQKCMKKRNIYTKMLLPLIIYSNELLSNFKHVTLSLFTCSSKQVLSLLSDMVDLKHVRTRLRHENVLSDVADVIGTVKYSLSKLCTSDSIDLYTVCVVIASHIVRTLVSPFTIGVASLIKSTR